MNHVPCQWVMSHFNESCQTSLSHVARINIHVKYQWVMSHINESCHISMSRVTYQQVMWDITESCPTSIHVTYQWVMSHINESCQSSLSHVPLVFTSYFNESCHISMSHVTYPRVILHITGPCQTSLSHVSLVRTISLTISWDGKTLTKWVMSNINESCHGERLTPVCVRSWMSHVTVSVSYVSRPTNFAKITAFLSCLATTNRGNFWEIL